MKHPDRPLSLSEVLQLPPPEWQIEGLWPTESLVVLYGPTKVGKSFLSLDAALSVAYGIPFLGRKTTQGGVLYMIGEGARGQRLRLEAWAQEKGVEGFIPPPPVKMWAPVLDFRSGLSEIKAYLKEMEAPSLVVVDTLARFFGGSDENETRDMNLFVNACQELINDCGVSVLVNHHTGLNTTRSRGSTSLKNASDTFMSIKPHEKSRWWTLKCEAQRDDEEFPDITLRRRPVREAYVWDLVPTAEFASKGPGAGARASLLALVNGMTQKRWELASGTPKGTLSGHVKELQEAGLIRKDEDGTWHRLEGQ